MFKCWKPRIIFAELMDIWVQIFKSGPSKICGRQPLKNLKWYGLIRQSSTDFTWSILKYLNSYIHSFNFFKKRQPWKTTNLWNLFKIKLSQTGWISENMFVEPGTLLFALLTIKTLKKCEICSKLIINWCFSGVFIVNFQHILLLFSRASIVDLTGLFLVGHYFWTVLITFNCFFSSILCFI